MRVPTTTPKKLRDHKIHISKTSRATKRPIDLLLRNLNTAILSLCLLKEWSPTWRCLPEPTQMVLNQWKNKGQCKTTMKSILPNWTKFSTVIFKILTSFTILNPRSTVSYKLMQIKQIINLLIVNIWTLQSITTILNERFETESEVKLLVPIGTLASLFSRRKFPSSIRVLSCVKLWGRPFQSRLPIKHINMKL